MKNSSMGNWDGTIIVTGGAGFIGSCMVRTLNDKGVDDIVIVDNIANTEKWKNLSNKAYKEYIHKNHFLKNLESGYYGKPGGIIHLGACSSTTERDFDYLWENNVQYTKSLWNYCAEYEIPFFYASSAATYGDGAQGFDDLGDIGRLRPMNGYGYSKQAFDQWALKQEKKPIQYVGFKFFNVYGPNEYFKDSMASMVYHGFRQVKVDGVIRLFKSACPEYSDGGQLRDFVYVKDVCDVISFFMERPQYSGIFNVGTGHAQSFSELASAVFHALEIEPQIEYFDMPEKIRSKYQYYTQAETGKLRDIGYHREFRDLKQGVYDYVTKYLDKQFMIY